MLLCLSGKSEDPSNLEKGQAIEMNKLIPNRKPNDLERETLLACGMQLSFYMGNIEKATDCYEKLKDVNVGMNKATVLYHMRLFFFVLVCIENFRISQKGRFKTEAKKHMDTLRKLVENGAINVVHKLQLLDAEFSSLTSKDTNEAVNELLRKYEKAVVSATRAGFLQDGALSNYLCAKFCLRQESKEAAADNYFMQSCELYTTWGALAVAMSVKQQHLSEYPEPPSYTVRTDSGFRSRTHFRASFAEMHKSLSTARLLGPELQPRKKRSSGGLPLLSS
jgi:hypothetical protein